MNHRNPILPGWYADPELHFFAGQYWLYPTDSKPYDEQLVFEAWTSRDLETWERHGVGLDLRDVSWSTKRAAWAPTVAEKGGRYYMYFSSGDGDGLGVAVADHPGGPFIEPRPAPIVKEYHHGAQPIDAHAFVDDDGQGYLIWGGWKHCVMAKLSEDMTSIDGDIVEITPENYVEGPFMVKRKGTYYLMWSEGGWGDASYQIAYARSTSPWGPFVRENAIFVPTPEVATSAGHHSVMEIPETDEWVLCYHRRPNGETDRNSRVTCLETMKFAEDGTILPVPLTFEGVAPRLVP